MMNRKYLIATILLLVLIGNTSYAQGKKPVKKKKATTNKREEPPPPKEWVPVLEPVGEVHSDPVLAYPSTHVAPIAVNTDSEEVQARSRKKHYKRPFVYWPSADTVINEDYNVYLARKQPALKNYSTGNFPDKKTPVIMSTTELYYAIEKDGKDTVRYYGDGWNQHSEFDKNGNRTMLYVIFLNEATGKDSMYLTTKYFYKGDKHAKTEHYWYATGRKEAEEEFEYDASGRIASEFYTPLDEHGKEIVEAGRGSRIRYIYENGKIEKQRYERPEDYEDFYVLDKYTEISLNSSGKSTKEVTHEYQSDAMYSTYKFEYDAKGNKVKLVSSTGYTKTYIYDERDNVIEETVVYTGLSNQKETTKYTYRYDTHGNWVEQLVVTTTRYEDGRIEVSKPMLCKRSIKYYKD